MISQQKLSDHHLYWGNVLQFFCKKPTRFILGYRPFVMALRTAFFNAGNYVETLQAAVVNHMCAKMENMGVSQIERVSQKFGIGNYGHVV